VNGRKIVPVYVGVNPLGTDPAQVACVKLTEDEEVFAVIGQFPTDQPLCYVEQHSMPVVGGTITEEYLARAKAPWYTLDVGDADTGTIIDALAKEGVFKKGKLGIVGASAQKTLIDGVVMPALKRNKVSGTLAIGNAPPGDVPAANAEMDSILERFKANGIKTVLGVGDNGLLVAQRLAKTDYRPRLVTTGQGPLQAYINTPGSDLSVLPGAITGNVGYPYDEPSLVKCRDMVAKATGETMVETPAKGEPSNRTSAETACRYVALFAALATAAGKNLTAASFGKAGQKAGSVEVPGSGQIAYDPKTHSFVQPVFLSRFDPTEKTLVTDAEPVGAKAASGK
jgi:hypothetical protein